MEGSNLPQTARSTNAVEALQKVRETRAAVHDMSTKVLQETLQLELKNSETCRRELLARDAQIENMMTMLKGREQEVQQLALEVQEQAQEIMQYQERLESTHIEQATYHRLAAQNKQLFEALRMQESQNKSLTDQVRELSTVVTNQQAHFSEKLKTVVYSESVDEYKSREAITEMSANLEHMNKENVGLKQVLHYYQMQLARTTKETRYATTHGVEQKIESASEAVEMQTKLDRLENEAFRARDACEALQQQLAREKHRNNQLVQQLQRASNQVTEPHVEVCTVDHHNKLKDQLQLAHKALFEETTGRRKIRDSFAAQAEQVKQLSAQLKTSTTERKRAKDAQLRAEAQLKLLQEADKRHEMKIQALENNRQMLREMLDVGAGRSRRPQTAKAMTSKTRPKSASAKRPSSEKEARKHALYNGATDRVVTPAVATATKSKKETETTGI